MKSKALINDSYKWITRRLFIYFAFWIWGFLLLDVEAGCPKVCQCKWKGGKQWVSCSSANFIDIPKGLEPSTQVLNLERNSLKILIRDAFVDRGLVNLQKVFLSFCSLRKLEKGSFRKLANLVELDLSNNFLTFVPTETLSDVSDLRDLKMRNNSLSYIPTEAFKGTPELVKLDLAYNKIKLLKDRAFAYLNKLEIIDLSGNKLHTLPVHILQPLDSLHGFYFHANPWNCNCFLRPLRQWMVERNIAASVPPSCFRPERLKDRLWDSLELDEFVCVPHVTPVAQRVLASHGDNVSLACRVETDDEALVTWLIGDKAVAKGDFAVEPRYRVLELLVPDRGNASRVSNLTISGADLEDQGIYRCVVENKAGRVETNLTLKVSEVISEDPLVEIDQVFVAGALLGGLAFVIFAIFIACAIFYRRKRRHAQNLAKINNELLEQANQGKLPNNQDQYKLDTNPEYRDYQILTTSDDPTVANYKRSITNKSDSVSPSVKCPEFYNRDSESENSNITCELRTPISKVCSSNQPEHLEHRLSKPSIGADEPLLQDLAQQCKNEALKRQKSYKENTSIFSNQPNVRYPDLLTSQTSDFQYCTIPRG